MRIRQLAFHPPAAKAATAQHPKGLQLPTESQKGPLWASCPVAGHHWKESGPVLLTPTLQIFRGISKVPTPAPSKHREVPTSPVGKANCGQRAKQLRPLKCVACPSASRPAQLRAGTVRYHHAGLIPSRQQSHRPAFRPSAHGPLPAACHAAFRKTQVPARFTGSCWTRCHAALHTSTAEPSAETP